MTAASIPGSKVHDLGLSECGAETHVKMFQESVVKFNDSLILSSSDGAEEIQVWEPKTMAPYEAILEKKFFPRENTLQANAGNFVWSCHATKSIMNVWRWDSKEPVLRFPLRDHLTVFKTCNTDLCAGANSKGQLMLWSVLSGELIGEVDSAHYMEIKDIDLNRDMIISGGKDCKVRVWLVTDLMYADKSKRLPYAEFSEHTSEVTCVKFSQNCANRAFSASTDKQFKVYDLSSKLCIKTIQT